MAGLSPSAICLWAILSGLLLIFLVWHLYKFDRFQCLGWGDNATRSGGFKRVMTYSYLLSIPLLLFYSVTLTVAKYFESWVAFPIPGTLEILPIPGTNTTVTQPEMNIMPLPIVLWSEGPRSALLALYIAFSVAWALEIVSHLEELMFWLFLMATTPPPKWIGSHYFWIWLTGSVLALVGLPLAAIFTRHNLDLCEAYIFLVGSSGSLLITIASVRVNFLFPKFIRLLRSQGADPETIVRLTTYSQLNDIRVIFRFLFVVPLLILAVDAIAPGQHVINSAFFASDFLAMVGGLGCMVSSALTLLIFFPRQTFTELGYTVTSTTASFTGRQKTMLTTEMEFTPVYPSFDRIDQWRDIVSDENAPPGLYTEPHPLRRTPSMGSMTKRVSYPPTSSYPMNTTTTVQRRPTAMSQPFSEASVYTEDVKINVLSPFEEEGSVELESHSHPGVAYDGYLPAGTDTPSRPRSTYLHPLSLRPDRQELRNGNGRSPVKDPGSPFGFDAAPPPPLPFGSETRTPSSKSVKPNPLADVPFDQMRAHGERYADVHVRTATARGENVHPFLVRANNFRSPLDVWDAPGGLSETDRRLPTHKVVTAV